MIGDNTPERVFKIGELARVIARHLILVSPESTVNLACACRYLEEPVLSTLWETQSSWSVLLETLPSNTWGWEYLGLGPNRHVVRGLNLPLEESMFNPWGISVLAPGESIVRGLEQSPPLRVLDAPSLRE